MSYQVVLDQSVIAALDSLKPSERDEVGKTIDGLKNEGRPAEVEALSSVVEELLYRMKIASGLWLIFRVDESEGIIEALDLVRGEALLRFSGGIATPGVSS